MNPLLLPAITSIALGFGSTANAAVVTWTSQGTITDENVIQANVTSAFNLAGGSGTNVVTTTTQPVSFVNSNNSNTTVSNGITLTIVSGFNNGITSNVWDGTPVDLDFNTVMDGFAHSPGRSPGNGAFTLSGLTDGTEYSVQLFTSDTRDGIGNLRDIQFDDDLGNSTAAVLQSDKQFFIGTFTAVGTSQAFNAVSTNQGTSGSVILNAATVSVIPEPSTALLGGLAALLALLRRRR